MFFFMVGLLHNPITQEMHALTLVPNLFDTSLSIFHSFTTTFLSKWDNETFCVKCGLNADHFISLVRMRTKSAIVDFYGSTADVDAAAADAADTVAAVANVAAVAVLAVVDNVAAVVVVLRHIRDSVTSLSFTTEK